MFPHFPLLACILAGASAEQIQKRGLFVRPVRANPDPVEVPSAPTWRGNDVYPYTGSSTHLGDDVAENPTPQYEPAAQPNQCFTGDCAELTVEVAKQVIEQMVENLSPSSSSSPVPGRGGFVTGVRAPTLTGHPTATAVPNLNVAKSMSLLQEDLALFDEDEQDMYLHDRLCFYANVERQYASLGTASPTPTNPARRDIWAALSSAAPSTLASSDASYYQSLLWNYGLPANILSIYAPVTANASMTTATTTCSGLGGAPSITMEYVEARVSSSSPTPTATNDMIANAADAPMVAGSHAVFGAMVAFAALVVI